MKTKTIKTPLMMAAVCDQRPALPTMRFRASSCAGLKPSTVLFQDSAIMSGKNIGFTSLKNMFSLYIELFFMFLPRMMSLVVKQRVVMAGLVQELALKHKTLTSARMYEVLRHQKRSF